MKRSTRPGLIALVFMLTVACSLRLGGNVQQIVRQGRALLNDETAKELERGVIYVTPLMTLTPTPTPTPTLTPTVTLPASGVDGSGLQAGSGDGTGPSDSGGNGSGGPAGPSLPPIPPPPTVPLPQTPTLIPPPLLTLVPTGTPSPLPPPPSPTTGPPVPPPPPPPPGNGGGGNNGNNVPPPPPLSVAFRSANYTVNEFDSFAIIETNLNRTSAQTVTVLYTTLDGTASSPGDYLSAGGQLTFPPGVTSQSFNVGIIDDLDIEGPETIRLELGSPTNAILGMPSQASLTIGDDDLPGVQFSSPSYNATEASGSATITVTLTSAAPFTVSVDYATRDGTAAAGSDYTAAGGTLTFNPGPTVLTFSVPVLRDAVIEMSESVNLALSNPVNANPGSPMTATLTIADSTLSQLTATTGCPFNLAPASNADGTRLIFRSNCNPVGTNADGSFEIFMLDTNTNNLNQLTTSLGCDNNFATISDDGAFVAFQSTCDPFGTNIDGNPELILFDTSTGISTQLTNSAGCLNQEISINADGSRIAFRSGCDLAGSNADGNDEIFLLEPAVGTPFQLTTTTGCLNAEPSISAGGTRIALDSTCDPLGSNGDNNFELFLYDTTTSGLTQLTTTIGCQSLAPSISDDGMHVMLRTNCNPAGSNPDGNFEIGLVDVAVSGILTTLTSTAGCNNFAPASNIDGSRVALYANCDPLGTNGDGNFELFLFNAGTLSQFTQTVGCGNQDPASDNTGASITFISDCNPLGTNGDGNFEIFQAILN